jgi:hypothetical protein
VNEETLQPLRAKPLHCLKPYRMLHRGIKEPRAGPDRYRQTNLCMSMLAVAVLAAGKGNTDETLPKVLHPLAGASLVEREHLLTCAAVPFRDPDGAASYAEIVAPR